MKWYYLLLISLVFSCGRKQQLLTYESETLQIEQITENTFLHVSYLNTESFGKVPCNGIFVVDNGDALIIDTPADDTTSVELIKWIENNLEAKVVGVVATHFHVDCLGGLNAFHEMSIPSYANNKTIELLGADTVTKPMHGFDNYLELTCGNMKVINEFLGEGHTRDNIVTYVPDDHLLFGGCMIKSLKAGKGNLEDANLDEWSNTVANVMSKYKNIEIVVPGHGNRGNADLLTYTIEMFRK